MAESLLWRDLTPDQLRQLDDAHDPAACKELLSSFLGLPATAAAAGESAGDGGAAGDARLEVLRDVYFYALAFAREKAFPPAKTCVLLSVFRQVIEADTATCVEGMEESFARFSELLRRHAVERPPASAGILSPADVGDVVDYFTHSYYRHFRLYKYVFTPRRVVHIVQEEPGGVEAPRKLRPLAQALPQEVPAEAAAAASVSHHLRRVQREVEARQQKQAALVSEVQKQVEEVATAVRSS